MVVFVQMYEHWQSKSTKLIEKIYKFIKKFEMLNMSNK